MILLTGMLVIPNHVSAILCDYRTIADYRDLASNIRTYTNYQMVDGQPVFTITFTNIYDDIYIVDETNPDKTKKYTSKNFDDETTLVLSGYKDNQRLTFKIYTSTDGCYGQILGTRYVTLPNYNELSVDPICVGAEEYSLCQRWGANSITNYDDFVSKVNKYKEARKQKITSTAEKQPLTWKEKILKFIGNYYVYLVSGIVILILILAALKSISAKKHEFNFKV